MFQRKIPSVRHKQFSQKQENVGLNYHERNSNDRMQTINHSHGDLSVFLRAVSNYKHRKMRLSICLDVNLQSQLSVDIPVMRAGDTQK